MKYSILTFHGLSALFSKLDQDNGQIARVVLELDEVTQTSRYIWNNLRNEFITDLILSTAPATAKNLHYS